MKLRAKTFTLPDVQVGSIIEYHFSYNFEDNFIFSSDWVLSEELFTKRAVFTLKPFERYPWTVQWSWPAGLPKDTEPPKQGADRVVRMTAQNVPAFVIEDHMPPPNELKFRVNFIYRDEAPELDVVKYWREFNKKRYGQVESFVDKRKAMEEAVAGIISAAPKPSITASPISNGTMLWLIEAIKEPRANTIAPSKNIFLRPNKSPSRPPVIVKAAKIKA